MRLQEQQVQAILKAPNSADKIHFAARQEQRLVFHTEPVQDTSKLNPAYSRWLGWVKAILPADKWVRFESLITTPLPTNKQCQSIFTELRKVFDSQNGSKKLQFIDPTLNQDFQEFDRKSKISDFMSTRGWEAVKTNISSFVVIDLPSQQITPRPEPYAMIVCIASVFDCLYDESERLQYLMYSIDDPLKEGKQTIVVLDDEFYRIYRRAEAEWAAITEIAHSTFDALGNTLDGPGYVPAHGIWNTASKVSHYVDKVGPITNVLGDLDYLLFKEISFKYLGLYGDYPILFTFKQECDYKNDQGAMCEGGKIERQFAEGDGYRSIWEDCPACSARKRVGPGSTGEIDAPRSNDDPNLMDKPIHIAEVSTELLAYGGTLLDDLEEDIFNTCVGMDAEPVAMAQNEKQVQKSFESKQNVLLRIAANIDATEKFIYDTVCYLRYGRKYYLGSSINAGTQFYLSTPEDLDARYAAAKTAGKPMYELADLRDLANKTENRSNPEALARKQLLSQLEPWADLSLTQIQGLGLQNADQVNFIVKINFNSYIDRFERENMNIVEFGSAISIAQKIKIITQKLQEYGKESLSSAQPNPAADAGAAPKPAGQ